MSVFLSGFMGNESAARNKQIEREPQDTHSLIVQINNESQVTEWIYLRIEC